MIVDLEAELMRRRMHKRRPLVDELKNARDHLADVVRRMYPHKEDRVAECETLYEELMLLVVDDETRD